MKTNGSYRLLTNLKGKAVDLIAYPSALSEGRIAGKYMLSNEKIPNTLVIQGFNEKGIIAGADTQIDKEAASKNNIKIVRISRSGRGGPKPVRTNDYSELIKNASRKFKNVETTPDDPAVILYTSGTTGKPKGVTLTHKNFISQVNMIEELMPLKSKDTVILVLPLFHVYGLSNGLICGLSFGCSLSLIPQYSPQNLLNNIKQVKATVLIAVPTMYMHLLKLARTRKTDIPKSLRLCVSGGAPLALSTINEFIEIFKTQIAEGYGLTETTSAVSLNKTGEFFKAGSIGPTSKDVEMKIVDNNFNELENGKEGEIVIKGQMVTSGYWNNEKATKESIKDGWLLTGDLGYKDKDGFFFITDRKKDLIVKAGFNISPREVEEVIMTNEAVEECAVVSVKDKSDRETVKAFIVLKNNMNLDNQTIFSFCQENLAAYKIPKYFEFIESLPKSATGKVLRKELRNPGSVDDRLILKEDYIE